MQQIINKKDIEQISKFTTVETWLKTVRKHGTGSKETQTAYLQIIARRCKWDPKINDFAKEIVITPDQLIANAKNSHNPTKYAQKDVEDYFDFLENTKKYKRKTVSTTYGALRSFYRANDIIFTEKTPKTWAEKTIKLPDKQQLQECLDACRNLRERFCLLALRDTGLSRSDFTKLKYGDIKQELQRGETRLYIEKTRGKEKTKIQTFLGMESTMVLKMYLRERQNRGETLTNETPLIRAEYSTVGPGKILTVSADALSRIIGDIGSRAGVELTPHVLRKYFRTQCGNAIGRANEHILIMGGWKLPGVGQSYQYPSREEILESYIKCEAYLKFEKPTISQEEQALQTLKDIARSLNLDPIQIFKRKGEKLTIQEKREALLGAIQLARQTPSGGLPFEVQARKALADILFGAITDLKQKLAEL